MRFLIDAQLPAALARSIAERGHEAEHVGDVGLARASDAEATGSVIVTKDEDFARRRALSAAGPQSCGCDCRIRADSRFWTPSLWSGAISSPPSNRANRSWRSPDPAFTRPRAALCRWYTP